MRPHEAIFSTEKKKEEVSDSCLILLASFLILIIMTFCKDKVIIKIYPVLSFQKNNKI